MKTKHTIAWILYVIASFIIIGSHVYMLLYGLPELQHRAHAIINLAAAGMLSIGASLREMK